MNLLGKDKTVLLTGATGFLGAYYAQKLLSLGVNVKALIREKSSKSLVYKILNEKNNGFENFELSDIEWIEGDLMDIFSIEDALHNTDWILHCAGFVSFDEKDHAKLIEVNYKGTQNIINSALHCGNVPVVYVSSIAALGRAELTEVINEETPWKNSPNNSMYAISKYMGEREVWRGMQEGLNVLVVNPAVILGRTEYSRGTGKFWQQIHSGLKFYTLGSNGFVDVRDVVNFTIKLIETQEAWSQKYILSGENHSYRNFFSMIAKSIGKKEPTIAAKNWMIAIVWRLEKLKSLLTGKRSLITKESAKNACLKSQYDNSKSLKITNLKYTPIAETIEWVSQDFLKSINK